MNPLFDHHLDLEAGGSFDPRALPSHGGVYLIVDRDDRPVLLASGQDLRRVVVSRLAASPPDQKTKRANLGQVAARVYWRDTFSRFEAAWAHWRIARVFNPKSYRESIAFSPAWFLRVDLAERTPRFKPVHQWRADGARIIGPFATRRHADDWIGMLTDAFDLCRDHPILEQAPHGRPCAYFDMGRCSAPCNGSIPLAEYRQAVSSAADFSSGNHAPHLAFLKEAMRAAATGLSFEKAAALKHTLEHASAAVKRPEYRHLAELSDLCWLIVQRAGPARRAAKSMKIKPFFVRCGTVEIGSPVNLADLEAALPGWLARCGPCSVLPPASDDDQTARCEVLWLVSKFLFQADRAPGLFIRFDHLPDADRLAQAIRERFAPTRLDEDNAGAPPTD